MSAKLKMQTHKPECTKPDGTCKCGGAKRIGSSELVRRELRIGEIIRKGDWFEFFMPTRWGRVKPDQVGKRVESWYRYRFRRIMKAPNDRGQAQTPTATEPDRKDV